jgi:hypothetical protein
VLGGRWAAQVSTNPLDRTEDLSGFRKVWLRSWSSVLAIRALHGVGHGVAFRFAAAGGARCAAAAVARKWRGTCEREPAATIISGWRRRRQARVRGSRPSSSAGRLSPSPFARRGARSSRGIVGAGCLQGRRSRSRSGRPCSQPGAEVESRWVVLCTKAAPSGVVAGSGLTSACS